MTNSFIVLQTNTLAGSKNAFCAIAQNAFFLFMAVGNFLGLGVLKLIVFNFEDKLVFPRTNWRKMHRSSTYVKFPNIFCRLESRATNSLAICFKSSAFVPSLWSTSQNGCHWWSSWSTNARALMRACAKLNSSYQNIWGFFSPPQAPPCLRPCSYTN